MPFAGLLLQAAKPNFEDAFQGKILHFSADSQETNGPNDKPVVVYEGHVTGLYGDETLSADRVETHLGLDERYLIASGHVSFTDPDGTIQAQEVRFCWKPGGQILVIKNGSVKIANLTVRAARMDLRPSVWTLHDWYATNDSALKPFLSVSGKDAEIYPGREAILHGFQVNILDDKLIGFARRIFNLDPRASGLHLPTPEYRPGRGLGYNWSSDAIIGPNTSMQLHSDAAPGDLPGYGASVTKSFLGPLNDKLPLAPASPFSQRFGFGYFENIFVQKPSSEISSVEAARNSLSVQSNFNEGVSGRGYSGEVFSEPAILAYELGGKDKLGGGYLTDYRLQEIDQYRQRNFTRAEFNGSYELPVIKLGSNLFNVARLDGAFFEDGDTYGWARATESLVYNPKKNLTLGAAAFTAVDSGTPRYDIDPLVYRTGIALRADYTLGPRSVSLMERYDTSLKWFDTEFKFTQAMGSFEAFVIYRQYPGDTHYGVTLRIDQIETLLTRRNQNGSRAVKSVGLP